MREASLRSFFCLRFASRLISAASPMSTRWPRPSRSSTNHMTLAAPL